MNECPENYTYVSDPKSNGSGKCVPCKDGKCPKSCFGLKHTKWSEQIEENFGLDQENWEDKSFQKSLKQNNKKKTGVFQQFQGTNCVHECFLGTDYKFRKYKIIQRLWSGGWINHLSKACLWWRYSRWEPKIIFMYKNKNMKFCSEEHKIRTIQKEDLKALRSIKRIMG